MTSRRRRQAAYNSAEKHHHFLNHKGKAGELFSHFLHSPPGGLFPCLCLHPETLLSWVSCFDKGTSLEPKNTASISETFFSKVKPAIPSGYGHQAWLEFRETTNA